MKNKELTINFVDKLACGPVIFFCGILFSVFLHENLGMDAFWDTANYHIYLGWAASNLMFYDFGATAQYQTYLNPLIDIVNYKAFSIHPFFGAAVHSIFFGMAAYIVFKISQFFSRGEAADKIIFLIGVIISVTGAMTVSLFGSWTNENISAVFVLAGLYFLLRGIDNEVLILILISGLAFGIALGLKLTSAHYMVGALIATVVSTRFNFKTIATLCTGILISFLVTDGFFMYLRWEAVDNPIFPFANNVFKSQFFPEAWKSFSHFDPSKTLYYLSLPIIWLNSGDFSEVNNVRDGRFLLAYIGIGLTVLGFAIHRKIGRMELVLIAFFLASFMAWILAFRVYRYLVALEMISGILFIIGLRSLLGSRKGSVSIFIALGALLFLWLVTFYPNWGRREWSETFAKSNLTELIKENKGVIVFFTEQRLSFMAPELYEEKVRFANLYSQQWWDGKRGGAVYNPDSSIDPVYIDISEFNKIYFLQYSKLNPKNNSAYLRKLFNGKIYSCQSVSTNMGLAPLLCSFDNAGDLPLMEPGITYYHNSKNILFSDGWSHEEESHRWTDGVRSSMLIKINKSKLCAPLINISGSVLGMQNIEVLVDGSSVFLGDLSGDVTLTMRGKSNTDIGSNIVNIELVLPGAHAPGNGDTRKLGFALRSFKFECAQPSKDTDLNH